MKLYKRFLAIVMVLVMIAGMGSVQAFAEKKSATASFSAIGSQPGFIDVDDHDNGSVSVGAGGMSTMAESSSTNGKNGTAAMWKDENGYYYLAYYSVEGEKQQIISPEDVTGHQEISGNLTIEIEGGERLELGSPDKKGNNSGAKWHILKMSSEELKKVLSVSQDGNKLQLKADAGGFSVGDLPVSKDFFDDVVQHIGAITYQWSGDIPPAVTLPAPVAACAEGELYSIDTSYSANFPIEVEDGNGNVIVYTFSGWSTSAATISGNTIKMPDHDVVFTGTWTKAIHTPAAWKITYAFTGDVPEAMEGKEPVDETVYADNAPYTVDTTVKKGNKVENKDVYGNVTETYTFQGWDAQDGTITGDMTIKGEWTKAETPASTYTVTYVDGVEDKVFADEIHKDITNNSLTPAFVGSTERAGYQFRHWTSSLEEGSFTAEAIAQKKVIGDVTYTAQWEENQVIIHYVVDSDGGGTVSQSEESVLCDTGTPQGATATPDKDWKFEKWTVDDGTEDGKTVSEEEALTGDVIAENAKGKDGLLKETTFTAHFKQVEYDAHFYFALRPDTPLDSNDISVWGPRIGTGRINLDGAEFKGINCNIEHDQGRVLAWPAGFENGSVPIDMNNGTFKTIFENFRSKLDESVTEADVTYVRLIPYKISDNRGSNDGFHVDCRVEIAAKVYAATFWLWDAGADGFTNANRVVVRDTDPTTDTDNQVQAYTGLAPDKIVEHDDNRPYHLISWYMDSGCTTPAAFPYTVNANVDFYAKYVPDYYVAYDLDGGTVNTSEIEKTYYSKGAPITVISEVPTKDGHKFLGWKADNVQVTDGGFKMPGADVTLVAQWDADDYTLTYDANGGIATSAPVDKNGYHIDDTVTLSGKAPTHADTEDGKKVVFLGWTEAPDPRIYTKDDTTVPTTISEVKFKTENITVYAVWGYDEDGDHTPDATEHKLTITGEIDTVVYNGLPRELTGYTAEGLDAGHEITGLSYIAEGTDASESPYKGSFEEDEMKIVDADGKNVTDTYFITTVPGELTITPATLTITTPDDSKTYDGTALTAEADEGITGFVNGETATFTVTGTQTDAGSSENTYSLVWDGTAKESNYTLNDTVGTLTITPATLTVTTPSASKLYDGEALTATVNASITGFVNGETATFTVTGTQTEAGSSENTYSLVWDGTAKASNYTVKETLGTLKVDPAHRLTVLYIYANGTPAADPYSEILPVGEAYSVESPAVAGFTANTAFVTGTIANEDVVWRVTYTANAPVLPPLPPVVVDTPDGPIEADPNPDGGIELDPENYTLIPITDEGTPLANLGLDGHIDCALHFLLILAAMLVVIAYTHSMKKHQKKLQELTEELELEKKRRGVRDDSGEKK